MSLSRSTRVISHRRAHELLHFFVHTWMMDSLGAIGTSPGIADVEFGMCVLSNGEAVVDDGSFNDRWKDITTDDPATVRKDVFGLGSAAKEIELRLADTQRGALGRAQLLTLDRADSVLRQVSMSIARDLFRRVKAKASNGKSTFRKWLAYQRAIRRLAQLEVAWREKLLKACYPQRKARKGVQTMSIRKTRRASRHPVGTRGAWFTLNGRPAYRPRLGRPALPESVWLQRYQDRLAKRRKGIGAMPRKRKKPVKVPPLSSGLARPARTWHPPNKHDTVTPRNLFVGLDSTGDSPFDYWADSELDAVIIAGDFPDMTGQV